MRNGRKIANHACMNIRLTSKASAGKQNFCPAEAFLLTLKQILPDSQKVQTILMEFYRKCCWISSYGDLMLFHLVIGAMYLAKEEMTYEGENVSVVRKLLKQFHPI